MTLALCFALVQAPAGPPVFEVASIKASAPGARGMSLQRGAGGRFTTENTPLNRLILFAYDIRDHQLTGGPGWIHDEGFDIVARPDRDVPNGPAGNLTVRLMLQALLADRFRLTVHRESKEMPTYALVVAKNGPRMTESAPESRGPAFRMGEPGNLNAIKVKMTQFAQVLSNQLGRTVVDQTGLTADYDFKLEYTPDAGQRAGLNGRDPGAEKPEVAPPGDAPSLFTALQEQLGLKLEAQKGMVEIVVVDRAEKPTEN